MRAATVKLWALHLVGDAVAIAAFWFWLTIGDSSGWQLLETALFGVLVVAFSVWLQGTAFAHFGEPGAPLVSAFRASLKRLLPLVAVALLAAVVYWLLSWLMDRVESPANKAASWLTLHLRKPVHPPMILSIFMWGIRIVEWMVVPVILLPLVPAVAAGGWRGFARWPFSQMRAWTFWALCPALLLLTIYVPWKLLHWVPYQGALAGEVSSFLGRWLVAWLLFVTAWFATVAFVSGRPLWRRNGAGASEPDPTPAA